MAAFDFQTVGHEFVKYYYNIFDTNRGGLVDLYRDQSMLTFEGAPQMGAAAIMEKLKNLPFQKVQHAIKSADCQPSGCGGIIVFVVGQLLIDDSPNPLMFSQSFHLMPVDADNKSFWIHNDLFRLNYG